MRHILTFEKSLRAHAVMDTVHAGRHVDRTQQLFDYSFHEGNHAMRNILSAAQAAEQGSTRKQDSIRK